MRGCGKRFRVAAATCDRAEPLRAGSGFGFSPATREERGCPAQRRDRVMAVLALPRELEKEATTRFRRLVIAQLFVETREPTRAFELHEHEPRLLRQRKGFHQRRSGALRVAAERVDEPKLSHRSAAGVSRRLARSDHIAVNLDHPIPFTGLPENVGQAAQADLRTPGNAVGLAEIE